MVEVSYLVAFAAGIVSFLAPCVLPLVPGFLAYLAGTTVREGAAKRWDIFVASLLFVAGLLARLLPPGRPPEYGAELGCLRCAALAVPGRGLIIIFFGLYLTGLIRVGWLEQEHKIAVTGIKSKYLTSFLFGIAFAAGWTPCVGAALGAIIGLAATQPALTFSLLLAYSLGLGLPFIIVGLFASRAAAWITRYSHILYYVNIVFGVLLIIVGILIFTQTLALVANLPLLNNFLLGG